ncbi:Probable LRR receptor-like serine/threonine-protein kinase At3g47570 [Linum perenne]
MNPFMTLTIFLHLAAITMAQLAAPTNIQTDKESLLAFKSEITSQSANLLPSWNQTTSSPCQWEGVTCNRFNQRVESLNLSNSGLTGSISPHIGNLSFLRSLQLQNNQLIGSLPDHLGSLVRLRVLNLSSNSLEGSIPLNISRMVELRRLDLSMNRISGRLHDQLGLLPNLQFMNLGRNLLSGPIPASISNLSSLVDLNLGTNSLSGSIPSDLSRLERLQILDLTINNLTGTVPPPVFNMSSLRYIALASNDLRGRLPGNIGDTLPNLYGFNFCFNKFSGAYPASLHNLTNIRIIRMAHMLLDGTVPSGLENLPQLEMYNIGFNKLVSSGEDGLGIITSLTNSTRLKFLAIDGNMFEGVIPESVGNLSKDLEKLYMGGNQIRGGIPASIGRLRSLTLLNISYNSITGEIPDELGKLKNLQELILAGNQLAGGIPDSIGNLQKLNQIDLSRNQLVGGIPSSFRNFRSIASLDLSSNSLNGSIPKEVLSLPSLSIILNLSHNSFSGELNQDIGLLQSVVSIDLSSNLLSGNIPDAIRNCKSLEKLYMAKNSFTGSIPRSLGEIKGLEVLDLSNNSLSGIIPPEVLNLQALQSLNLSFNNLEVNPCSGAQANLSRSHLEGNPKIHPSLACKNSRSNRRRLVIVLIISAVVATAALCFTVGSIYYMRNNKKKVTPTSGLLKEPHQMVSYDELRRATDNFSTNNLIGEGGFGSVYKGKLADNNNPVAIKVLNAETTGSWNSFLAECKALRNVKHRNLVKLITTCSSLDHKNEEFWALVYEFLPNGSLADWLRNRDHEFNLLQRLDIAIDVASVLFYLHHDSEIPVIHCDLKPSNILLDQDMTAKVGDFGLAKLLIGNQQSSISTLHCLKGSIGYIPPEYGLGSKPSTAGDVYSFGVTLLELITGKSPTDVGLSHGTLVEWVKSASPDDVMRVVERNGGRISGERKVVEKAEQCVMKVIGVGLSCTAELPEERITMRDALWKLQAARKDVDSSSPGESLRRVLSK